MQTDSHLGDEGANVLSEGLRINSTLTKLMLMGNKQDVHTEIYVELYNNNNQIVLGNDIGNEGARMLCESLKTNPSLTSLLLYSISEEILRGMWC